MLDEFHGKKNVYGPRVGEGREVAQAAATNTGMTTVADEVPANDLARQNLVAELADEQRVRRVSTDPKDLAEVKDFETTMATLKELRAKQTTGTPAEKKVAEAAMQGLMQTETARAQPRDAILKRLYRFGIGKT